MALIADVVAFDPLTKAALCIDLGYPLMIYLFLENLITSCLSRMPLFSACSHARSVFTSVLPSLGNVNLI